MQLVLPAFLFALVGQAYATSSGDKTISRVVKLLQDMQEKLEATGEQDRTLYGKYKCYCDSSEESKINEVSTLTETIGLLESDISALKGKTGEASSICAKLKADTEANMQAREEATAIRQSEKKAFDETEADLSGAIEQMKSAISTLADIGADQTLAAATDHKKFMSGNKEESLLKLKSTLSTALSAAVALLPSSKRAPVEAFLQSPFTGSYSAQSGAVVGILKEMLETFSNNLKNARATEAAAVEAFDKFILAKTTEYDELKDAYNAKQEAMGSQDEDLSTKKVALSTARDAKEAAEEFLMELKDMCDKKAKEYQKRTLLRTNEAAAIAKAIAILDSDAAFETFGMVDATSTGATGPGFLQTKKAIRVHVQASDVQQQVQVLLTQAASKSRSGRLFRAAMLLKARNPFRTVLKEIDNMLSLIEKESEEDSKNLAFCNSERSNSEATISAKETSIDALTSAIQELTNAINDPKTGLNVMIEEKEAALDDNRASQATETEQRKEENLAYQKDIANLVEAQALLKQAIQVLKKYYDNLTERAKGTGLLQKHMRRQPSPPETWEEYKGQNQAGETDAISMLEFILKQSKEEEMTAHSDEHSAQHDYEDSMQTLKSDEKNLEDEVATLKETLAEKKISMLQAEEDLESTVKEKEALEAYLLKIKPGCDFITANIDERESNRNTEKEALSKAVELLEATPAYKNAMDDAHQAELGKCKDICNADGEEFATCKACIAGVTVPGYCAGHAGTPGCEEGTA